MFCTKCQQDKDITAFGKDAKSKTGLKYICKSCCKEYAKMYYENNKQKLLDRSNQRYEDQKEKICQKNNRYYHENKEQISKKRKSEEHRAKVRANRSRRRDICNQRTKEWRENNPDKVIAYRNAHRGYIREWSKNRRKDNIQYKLAGCLRHRVNLALRSSGNNKQSSTVELLGCDIDFLKEWLSSLFIEGMTWDNYGKWHVDHYVPCAYFDLSDVKQQRICFNYRNLRPLWGIDNMKKRDALPDDTDEFVKNIENFIF